jgi:hypothetical protein
LSLTRKLLSFLGAIVLTAFVLGLVIALPPFYPQSLDYPRTALGVFFTAWVFSLPIVAVAGLVLGLPIASFLKSSKVSRPLWWAMAGAVAGSVFSFLVFFALGGPWPGKFDALAAFDALTLAWIGFLPGLTAGIFWWAAIARREVMEDPAF